jgi:hypothetical protein
VTWSLPLEDLDLPSPFEWTASTADVDGSDPPISVTISDACPGGGGEPEEYVTS